MTTPPTIRIVQEATLVLFADCPFCLAPLPMDLATGSMDCPDCVVHLELAEDPEPLVLAPAA